MPKLQISVPNVGDSTHELTTDEVTLGRSSSNKIQVRDGSVSIFHARLTRQGGVYVLEDLNSTNGTFVNGAQITRHTLDDSSALRFGNINAFFHRDPGSPPKANSGPNEEMRKLQTQVASLREARDLIHARNEALLRERDEAAEAKDLAAAELIDLKTKVAAAPDPDVSAKLERKLEEQRTQVVTLINERKALEAQKADIARQLREAGQAREKLEGELAEANRQHEESQRQLDQERQASAGTAQKSAELEKEVAELIQAKDAASNAQEAATRELEERANRDAHLAAEIEPLRQQKEELQKSLAEAAQSAQGNGEALARLQAELDTLRSEKSGHEEARQDWQAQLEMRTAELEKIRGEMKMMHGEIEGDLDARRGDLEEQARRLTTLEADKQSLEQKLAREHETVSSSGRETQRAQAEVQQLRRELDEIRSQVELLAQERDTLRRQQQAMVGQLDEHHAARDAVAQASEGLNAELHETRERLQATEEKMRQDQAAHTLAAEEFAAEKTRIIGKTGAFENERNQLARALEEEKKSAGDMNALRGALDEASKAATFEKGRAENLAREIATLRDGGVVQKAKAEAVANELQSLRDRLALVEKERDQEIARLRSERAKAHGDLDVTMKRLTASDEALQGHRSEIAALNQRLEAMETAAQNGPSFLPEDEVDDPFTEGRGGGMKAETARGLRPRRASAKIEQRMQHRVDAAAEATNGTRKQKEDQPLWIGRKSAINGVPRADAPLVFPEDLVAEDCATMAMFPPLISQARGDLQYLVRHPSDLKCLENLRQQTRAMATTARTTVFRAVYNLTSALDGLLGDLHATPERINQATLRTVTQTFDFLTQLVEPIRLRETLSLPEPHVMTIDDEPDVLDAIVSALELVGLPTSGSCNPLAAVEELAREKFDLVFLDVRLPEVTGWDVCQKIRNIPEHRRTPIIFVSGMDSVENKVKSTLQGGNDFVGKPFNIRELGIKGLIWVYRGQLNMI